MANWLVESATQGIFCQTSVYAQVSTRDEKQTKLLSDEKVAMGLMRISPLRKIKKSCFIIRDALTAVKKPRNILRVC